MIQRKGQIANGTRHNNIYHAKIAPYEPRGVGLVRTSVQLQIRTIAELVGVELKSWKHENSNDLKSKHSFNSGSMFVVKRLGQHEPVMYDKITLRIEKLCTGLDRRYVDPTVITQKVAQGVFSGVTTSQLDELAAETAAYMTTQHPDYGTLAARISVSNL